MKIENHALLESFRTPGPCSLCERFAAVREPHHVRASGMGGTPIEIRINLIALGGSRKTANKGRYLYCHCHTLIHAGKIPPSRVLSIVAAREGCTVEAITEVMDWLQRLIRPTDGQLRAALDELSLSALTLAVKELTEAGRL